MLSSLAENYESSSKNFQTGFCLKLLRNLPTPVEQGWRVLDLGCGTGTGTEIIAKLVGENGFVLGVDPNEDRIKFFENRIKSQPLDQLVIRNVGAENCPYGEYSSFDLVISNTVLHWIDENNLRVIFKQVYDNTKIGGYFAVSLAELKPDEGDFSYLFFGGQSSFVRDKILQHVYSRPLFWYTELAQQFGFDVVDSGYFFVESRYKDLKSMAARLTATFEGVVEVEKYLTMDMIQGSGIYNFRNDGSFSAVNRISYFIAQKK